MPIVLSVAYDLGYFVGQNIVFIVIGGVLGIGAVLYLATRRKA